LRDDDVDLRIHSLNVLGSIGDVSAVPPIRRLLHHEPADANVRFAAYEALGMLPLHKNAFMLAEGLTDAVEHVRIAAAKAVERQHNDIILAGIKNLLAQDEAQARHIVVALLHAEANTLCMRLINEEVFQYLAVAYLTGEAHPNLWTHFDRLLRQHGYNAIADDIEAGRQTWCNAGQCLIYAVDDSRMMLKIYQNTLHQLGFTSVLFEFPASALERAHQVKPAVLLTDLNMPEMTGLELTAQLRTRYSADELPIIMVTTQQDQQNHTDAHAAGVNAILLKPFTAEQLDAMLRRFVSTPSSQMSVA
jgi:CheY-like chemotaxis protein